MKSTATSKQAPRLISIVTPAHNEEQNIVPFFKAIDAIAHEIKHSIELIFVDDGSTDESVAAIKQLKDTPSVRVRLIELSRNFGKEIALTAGIEVSHGDAVLLIDSDLQHPVEKIPEFIKSWEQGNEVIIGVRSESASDTRIKRLGSKAFYTIMNSIGETKTIPHATDFRLLDRVVVDAFSRFTERQRITRGLIDWLGFKRDIVYFNANDRQFGAPSYSTVKLFRLAMNSFISHSLLPLKIAGYLGTVITVLSGILGVFIIVEHYWMNDPLKLNPSGTALLGVMLLFLVGVVLACLGLIALYIANIHGEVTNRPLYVTRPERT